MLGFRTDGIRFFGASDSLLEKAKKHKLPVVKKSTTNTLVFAIDTAEPLTKKTPTPGGAICSTPVRTTQAGVLTIFWYPTVSGNPLVIPPSIPIFPVLTTVQSVWS